MHLHDLLGWPGPMTHRQYRAWGAWLDAAYGDKKNRPTGTRRQRLEAAKANWFGGLGIKK